MLDPKQRFSDRADDYARYRPTYPRALLDHLAREHGFGVVADVGSGTGIFTRLLLDAGAKRVFAVEPNAAMRAAAERDLAGEPRFESVAASAEQTTLGDESVDLVTAAQAFHWFDAAQAHAEWTRILRAGGAAALVWNVRASTPLCDDYEDLLLRFAPDYPAVLARDRAAEAAVRPLFAPREPRVARFSHAQRFVEAGLRGRLLSSSYAPKAGHPMHEPMMKRLAEIFAKHAKGGAVEMDYECVCWSARLR